MTPSEPALRPVYAIFGPEAFLKRQALLRVVNLALADDPGSMGPTRIEGETAELADALDELQTPSLLGGRRVVIVESADAFITRYRKQLEAYCSAPVGDGCLILLCNSLPKNTRLYKIIAESGRAIECRPLASRQVVDWTVSRSREAYGTSMDPAAAIRLRELIGNDLGALDGEIGKLSAYVGQRNRIDLNDVDALVGLHREETIFRVTDAMDAGDVAGAMQAWEHVLATDRAAPMRAIGGLASGIRRLLEAKQAVAAGASIPSLVPRLGRDPRDLARRIEATTVGRLQARLCDLYETELASKTGLADVNRAIEAFIVKHTVPQRPMGRPPAGARA